MLRLPSIVLLISLGADFAEAGETPQQLEFFEAKIRPVLVEHCVRCHSDAAEAAKKLKGGLKLDSKAGWQAGGDSGPAIVPGKPGESLLLKSLKYQGDSHMPPEGQLPAAVTADFEVWIKAGAIDPRSGGAGKKQIGMSVAEGRKFWAYRPVKAPAIPATVDKAWATNDLDRFILATLEAKGLKPSADADKATLLRRVYFDLMGLPPTPEEIDEFIADKDPKAYENRVDKLLARSEFGERWGRHWLDVARYAESLTLRGFILKETWRYRDYVIDSFNADRRFDEFLKEQIAGDLMQAKSTDERRRQIIATAFLAMGNHNLEEQDKKVLRMDIVDEMLDVVSKGFLGQTVTCARCHDHKFDPIPTKDYYALAGIFRNVQATDDANVSVWKDVPLPVEPALEAEFKKHEEQVAALQVKIRTTKSAAAGKAGKGVMAIADVKGIVIDDSQAKKTGEWRDSTSTGTYIGAGYLHDDAAGKGEKSLTFTAELPATGQYEVRLSYSASMSRAPNVPVTVFGADGEKTIPVDMRKAPPVEGRYVSLGEYKFEKGGQSFVIVSNEGTTGHVTADAVVFISLDKKEAKKDDPDVKGQEPDALKALEDELKAIQSTGPKRPLALSVVERAKMEEAKIHIRGLVSNQGAVAPRGVLQVATTGDAPAMPKAQSGRLELAAWIASADNPLTTRVFANRAWHWIFGSGLVRTADNFGTTGEAPSHPELLDHLAAQFVAEGWSVKKLVRSLVLSRTYRQSTGSVNPADIENRLFGRANRKRLDAEVIRDSMLTISGALSTERGGQTYPATLGADYGYKASDNRRSVYLPVFRNSLPEFFEAFDFADPSVVVGARNTSTVAPQALFLLNNPFPIEQAKLAAVKLLKLPLETDDARITYAYRSALGRPPTDGEREVVRKYLKNQNYTADAWAGIVQSLFASAEFRTSR